MSRQRQNRSWWQRFRDPVDRRARRDYRRSLPPLYRWRRVLIAVLSLVCVIGLLYALGRDPVGWARARWYDVRGTLVPVDGVAFSETPANSTADLYSAQALGTPETDDAWATAWTARNVATVQACNGQRAATGMIRLTFADPVRVRQLEIVSGLPKDDDLRPLLFRPSRIYVMYGDGQCTPVDLKDDSAPQLVALDTHQPVITMTLAIGAAYPAKPGAPPPRVALSGATVYSRPS